MKPHTWKDLSRNSAIRRKCSVCGINQMKFAGCTSWQYVFFESVRQSATYNYFGLVKRDDPRFMKRGKSDCDLVLIHKILFE